MRDQGREIAADMVPDIQSHQIDQTEGRGFRSSDQWTGERIHFIDGVSILEDVIQSERARPKGDAVADEIGCVLAQHDSFPQSILSEPGKEFNHILDLCPVWE